MSDEQHQAEEDRVSGHPENETLPEGAPTAGEAALERGGNEFHGEKAGKGGDERDWPRKPQG